MSSRRCIEALALLLCCVAAYADPFAPADADAAAPTDYRVVGTAVLGARAVAVVRIAEGRFRVVRPGDRIGDAKVVRITPDAVHVETPRGISRRPVED